MAAGAPPSRRTRVLAAALGSLLGTALIVLGNRFLFREDVTWSEAVVLALVLFLLYATMTWWAPPLRRFFRGDQT